MRDFLKIQSHAYRQDIRRGTEGVSLEGSRVLHGYHTGRSWDRPCPLSQDHQDCSEVEIRTNTDAWSHITWQVPGTGIQNQREINSHQFSLGHD